MMSKTVYLKQFAADNNLPYDDTGRLFSMDETLKAAQAAAGPDGKVLVEMSPMKFDNNAPRARFEWIDGWTDDDWARNGFRSSRCPLKAAGIPHDCDIVENP
jgi:hypothetical protein